MIRESYKLEIAQDFLVFKFQSVGNQGIIDKLVVFEELAEGRYNLAFGDVIDGVLNDEVISNNFDFVKTASTVVKAIHIFFNQYPSATLEIEAVDEKRLKFYNRIIMRRYWEIESKFRIAGIIDGVKSPYFYGNFYQKFEIQLKSR